MDVNRRWFGGKYLIQTTVVGWGYKRLVQKYSGVLCKLLPKYNVFISAFNIMKKPCICHIASLLPGFRFKI